MNFNNPTISIIIPTINRSHLISRSIESILNQTYQNFEIIIVDSSQNEETKKIIENFQKFGKRIIFFSFREKRGIAAARNFGIKKSNGEYLAFQDDDDEWLPDKIEKQIQVFKNLNSDSEVGVVYTGFYTFEGNKKFYIPKEDVLLREGDIHKELLKGNFVSTQTMLIHKRCFAKAGLFNENLPSFEDWEFAIRVSKFFRFRIIDEPLVNAYIQEDSNSRNINNYVRSLEIIIKEHFDDFFNEKVLLAKYYSLLGHYYCSNGNMMKGRSYFIQELKIYPTILTVLVIGTSFFGERFFNKIKFFYKKIDSIINFRVQE